MACNGSGYIGRDRCTKCDDGFWKLNECPNKFIGADMVEAINMAGHAITKGLMPVDGGLLDQSSWFFDLWTRLESETHKIQDEQHKRALDR